MFPVGKGLFCLSMKLYLPGKIAVFSLGCVSLLFSRISLSPERWHKGRVFLLQYQHGKPQYNAAHELTSLEGTSGWTKHLANFPILPGTTEVRVILQMGRCTVIGRSKTWCRTGLAQELIRVAEKGLRQCSQRSGKISWILTIASAGRSILFLPLWQTPPPLHQ